VWDVGVGSLTLEEARLCFLRLVREFSPVGDVADALAKLGTTEASPSLAVLDELADEPLRAYQVAWARAESEAERSLLLCLGLRDVEQWPETRALRASVATWCERWHLNAPWCARVALETLDQWNSHPRTLEKRLWSSLSSGVYTKPWFSFETDGWSPKSGERESSARNRIRSQFERVLRLHLKAARASMQDGADLSATTRQPERAFEYLLCFQVLKLSFGSIAWVYQVDEAAISRSVRNLGTFLGLKLRESLPGRPLGTRSS
jgi:hypothetical protein